jgi:hypothetical protein
MELSDKVFRLVYGHDVDIKQIKKIKDSSEIWNDIFLFLANNDITKLEDVKNMKFVDVLEVLNSKVKGVPKIKYIVKPIGYKTDGKSNE